MPNDTLTVISAVEFTHRFARTVKEQGQRFTWFFGAGCSISSGIPATSGLVERWLTELYDMQGKTSQSLEVWAKGMFPAFNSAKLGSLYAEVFARRHAAPAERQREIEMICSRGYPAYGYATFAQLLSLEGVGHLCNTILTTNFDDLIADAIYLYGDTLRRPQIITHEALARYARISSPRPTIVKLHGDAHLDPKNLRPETKKIADEVARQIYPFLQDSALVFVGYGGNDESILSFLRDCPPVALAAQIYWVGNHDPSDKFREWLVDRKAMRVDIADFDRLMHLLRGTLNISHPNDSHWGKAKDSYFTKHSDFEKEISTQPSSEEKSALEEASTGARDSVPEEWRKVRQASALEASDADAADAAYQAALKSHPQSIILARSYARFLHVSKRDPSMAERHYKRAIEAEPKNASTLGNYATFLRERKEMDASESYYKRAIEADPKNANNLGNYANFLNDVRGDMDAAETYYKRAIEADPKHANNLGNYATFLSDARGDMNAADTYYKRAIEANPKHANTLGNYATFLGERKEMDAAETYYKRAIEADPKRVGNLGNYANFLSRVRRDMDAAEAYYKRAIEVDPKHASILGNYATFLSDIRRDIDAAETYYKRAIEAGPMDANNLGNYATFLSSARQDPGAAETYYKRAIEAGPKNATILGNYANFLSDKRRDIEAAETYYRRALEADPKHAAHLGNYSVFLEEARKDMDGAEIYHKRAIDADPESANNFANFARFLIGQGKIDLGVATAKQAVMLGADEPLVVLEASVYLYAVDADGRAEHLSRAKSLLKNGVRSAQWNFSPVVSQAIDKGHPNVALLSELAAVASDSSPITALESFLEWREAS